MVQTTSHSNNAALSQNNPVVVDLCSDDDEDGSGSGTINNSNINQNATNGTNRNGMTFSYSRQVTGAVIPAASSTAAMSVSAISAQIQVISL